MEENLKEFLETWNKRMTGELPMPDLRVTCQSCGAPVLPGEPAAFDKRGIVCRGCLNKILKEE